MWRTYAIASQPVVQSEFKTVVPPWITTNPAAGAVSENAGSRVCSAVVSVMLASEPVPVTRMSELASNPSTFPAFVALVDLAADGTRPSDDSTTSGPRSEPSATSAPESELAATSAPVREPFATSMLPIVWSRMSTLRIVLFWMLALVINTAAVTFPPTLSTSATRATTIADGDSRLLRIIVISLLVVR
jgi:hypothetical protein